jgi:hypothetical protein
MSKPKKPQRTIASTRDAAVSATPGGKPTEETPPPKASAAGAANSSALAPDVLPVSDDAEQWQRLSFIDSAAIARFGAGYPVTGCYREAEHLWNAREKWLLEQRGRR